MIRSVFATLALIALASPAQAQDHAAHQAQADPHAGHDMAEPETPAGADSVDHSAMDHAAMGHGPDAGAKAPPSPAPEMETPPPAQAGNGPPRAADAIWGADAMRASRIDLQKTHGDFNLLWLQVDRAEVQARAGADGYLWDVQGFYGGPLNRLWFKSEGEGRFGQRIEDVEIQALYSHAIAPFFDLQAGVRQDLAGPDTSYAVVGVQGLAPYMFELDAAVFLSHRGDITARIEAELDQRITQRLIVQPRAELNLSAQDVPELRIGAGIDSLALGVRLRYEIIREIAPYIGVEQTWRLGGSADAVRARGEDPGVSQFVVGVRLWF